MQAVASWMKEHKSAMVVGVLASLIATIIVATISGLFSDGSDAERDIPLATSDATALMNEGDTRYDGTTGDSSSKSTSQGADASVASSNAARSGNSSAESSSGISISESQSSGGNASAEIQNNANQNVTIIMTNEDGSKRTEPTVSLPNSSQSNSANDDTGPSSNLDLGRCRAGLQVGAGQRCSVAERQQSFEVYEDWTWSPWAQQSSNDYNPEAIKVDWGDPAKGGVTFQARRENSGVWTILVSGSWQSRGECSRDRLVHAGEYCIERRSNKPFLVYATDELNFGETRSLYTSGYAVLFWFESGSGKPDPSNGLLHNQQVWSGDHFLAEVDSDGRWRIVRAD